MGLKDWNPIKAMGIGEKKSMFDEVADLRIRKYLIPIWAIGRERPEDFRLATIHELTAEYLKKYPTKPVIRQLLASDLGLRSWRTPSQKPGEKSAWVNCEVDSGTYLIISGVTQLSKNPKISRMTIGIGPYASRILGLHELDELYAALPIYKDLEKLRDEIVLLESLKMTGLFSQPYIYRDREVIYITVESPEGNKFGDKLMLNGFVAETEGLNIA